MRPAPPARVRVADSDVTFPAQAGESILSAARRAGVWLPFECGWGSCSTCKLTLIEGEVASLFPEAPAITPRDERRGRILACQSTPVTDVVVKPTSVAPEPRPGFATGVRSAELVESREVGRDIRLLRFRTAEPVEFREGQHAILQLDDGLRRCYSMASLSGADELEFIAKRYAGRPGSERLCSLPVGSAVDIDLPYGDMWVRTGDHPLCLVAGGTGVAPILAMVRALVREGSPRPVRVFYGAGARDELVCLDELSAAVTALPDAGLTASLLTPGADWSGDTGLVTDALGSRLPGLSEADFHIAGPPPMAQAVLALLREAGTDVRRIHFDSFG